MGTRHGVPHPGFKDTTLIGSGLELALWFLYEKPGNTGRIACMISILMSSLKVVCNSDTLLPVAKAKRNKVFWHRQSSDALAASYLFVDSIANTLSRDQLLQMQYSVSIHLYYSKPVFYSITKLFFVRISTNNGIKGLLACECYN